MSLIGEEQRVREGALQLKVNALDQAVGNVMLFDLLQDRLVVTQKVVVPDTRHRGVDHASMFHAIETAYDGLHADLIKALSVET